MRRLLSLSLLLSFFGCQNKQDDGPLSTGELPPSVSEHWLTITDDVDALAEAARRAEQIEQEEHESIFAHLGDEYGYLDFETFKKLRGREDAIERLKSELSATDVSAAGVGAALLLCQFQIAEGRSYLAGVLERGDAKERIRALTGNRQSRIRLGFGAALSRVCVCRQTPGSSALAPA